MLYLASKALASAVNLKFATERVFFLGAFCNMCIMLEMATFFHIHQVERLPRQRISCFFLHPRVSLFTLETELSNFLQTVPCVFSRHGIPCADSRLC